MALGTGLAIGLGLITGGAQVASAAIGSKASKNAAKTQAQSADKALALHKQVYDTTANAFAPYQNAGTGAVRRISEMLLPSSVPQLRGLPAPQGSMDVMPMSAFVNDAGLRSVGRGMTPVEASVKAPQAVMIRNPADGSIREVPAHLVEKYTKKGGEVVTMATPGALEARV